MVSSFTKIKAHGGDFSFKLLKGFAGEAWKSNVLLILQTVFSHLKGCMTLFFPVGTGMYLSCEGWVVFLEGTKP